LSAPWADKPQPIVGLSAFSAETSLERRFSAVGSGNAASPGFAADFACIQAIFSA